MTQQEAPDDEPEWHDNLIYGLHFQPADPDRGLWRSNLVLDIDHIVEWLCGTDGRVRFRVAPASLVFRDVTNLKIDVDFTDRRHPQTVNALSIAQISKEPVEFTRGRGAPPDFDWSIRLNLPQDGQITFGSTGYTLTLRAQPLVLEEQSLPADDRPPLGLSEPKSAPPG